MKAHSFDIIQACDEQALFKAWFRDPATWRSWFAFMSALFGLPMGEEDWALFQQCTRVRRIRSAHLPDQQPYQARNGDGARWVLLNPRLDIALHGGELVLRDRCRLRQLSPAAATTPATWSREEATCF
jgi:hypothetical protein